MQQTIEGFRLSPQQARIWSLAQQSDMYPAYCTLAIDGPLDQARLQAALEAAIRPHDLYRTSFCILPGMRLPIQYIRNVPLYLWQYFDLSNCEPAEQAICGNAILQSMIALPLDSERGPILRCSLLTLEATRHLLLISTSALYADNQTFPILFHALIQAYKQDEPVEKIREDIIQYVQFSEWQHSLLEEDEDGERAYWRQQRLPATVSLPCKRPYAQDEKAAFAVITRALAPSLYSSIQIFLQQEQCSLQTLLLACWQLVLQRLTAHETVLIGYGVNGRIYEDLQQAVGPMTRYLPLQTLNQSGLSFREFVHKLQEQEEAMLARQYAFTWEDVESPTAFKYTFGFDYREQLPTVTANDVLFSLQTCFVSLELFELRLSVVHTVPYPLLEWHYQKQLFFEQDIHSLAEQITILLENAVLQPETLLPQLNMLSPADKTHLVEELNRTTSAYPLESCLHHLFEQQVVHAEDAIALQSDDEHLTYGELELRSNQLAWYLQAQGVAPEITVGIYMERSVALLISLFAILKAGGCYVPLDMIYPQERLEFIAEDAHIRLLLTQSQLSQRLSCSAKVLCLDHEQTTIALYPGERRPESHVTAENLAYVLYTSGSTGRPKGVMIAHRSVVHYVHWCCEYYALAAGYGAPVHSPLAFDLTVTSVFAPLASGRRVVLVPEGPGLQELCKTLRLHPTFSLLKITPAHLQMLSQYLQPEEFGQVAATLVVGGEALRAEHLLTWRQNAPDIRIINEYGPTETVVGCCIYAVPTRTALPDDIPIGQPIANTQLYILDAQMLIVPLGIAGELYIGGAGIGRGYFKRGDQTAESFMPDPFSSAPGARLYKTGDWVRYKYAHGELEYLGRIDRQVKLRGFRIELAEIEAVLLRHSNVKAGVVLLRDDESPQLVAYVIAHVRPLPTLIEIRDFMRTYLPTYMLPSSLVVLPHFPLTVNGKIDHAALPAPSIESEASQSYLPARNPIEEILVSLWETVLNIQSISVNDNFFHLGGHSLMATQFLTRLQHTFQLNFPLADFFAAPTIAQLAKNVEQQLQRGEHFEAPPLLPIIRSAVGMPLSFAQQRLWILEQLEPGNRVYLIFNTYLLQGTFDQRAFLHSLEALVERHEILRTIFRSHELQPVQIIQPLYHAGFPVVDLVGLEREVRLQEAQRLAQQEEQTPCNLAEGPLFRAKLLHLDSEEHVLLITMHHIITDAWSNDVLMRDLSAFYRTFSQGKENALSPLPIQYADFAVWQRQWLHGEYQERQLAYWQQQLADLSPLEMPTDYPRPPHQTFNGALHTIILGSEVQKQLQALSQLEGVTAFMLLLTAFQILLARYTGQMDICVGTPSTNRNHPELENLIGFFVNTLVMRTQIEPTCTFKEVLARVRKTALEAYTHQDIPFEQLVEILQPERDMSRSPLFQVMFMLQHVQNEPSRQVETASSELAFHSAHQAQTTAKFDLTFFVSISDRGWRCGAEYNTDLFSAGTIERFLEHWQILLQAIVAHPDLPVTTLPLLTAAEHQSILFDWNDTAQAVPERCLHTFFAEQAACTPDAIAVVYQEECLSYAELERRSNQLAWYLQGLDVAPDVLVGVSVERSLLLLISLLGVLKAGGAYLPLDPTYPFERLEYMMTDADVVALIARSSSLAPPGVPVIDLTAFWPIIAAQEESAPPTTVCADNIAYVIYTSGSTGTPKGVEVTHRGIGNLSLQQGKSFGIHTQSRILQFASLSFDASIWEIIMALLNGACIHLADKEHLFPGHDLLDLLNEQAITIVTLPPSALAALPVQALPVLETLIVAGEACSAELVRQWATGQHFWNAYGPTETTVCASMTKCESGEGECEKPAIGTPIANTQLYVLDEQLQPVPIHVAGELYISGISLARAYLKRPAETAERFIPHPFAQQPGARLYKTGDRVRYRQGGSLEYIGRLDQQIKIRGYRIELGEVEGVLISHEKVCAAAVVLQESSAGDKKLVAYIVSEDDHISQGELRRFLIEKLPEPMLPAHYVQLDSLPLTANGKIDRLMLQDLKYSSETEVVHPRDNTEAQLLLIWREVLEIESISVWDNFFDLGGHSVLAIYVTSRIEQQFSIRLPVSTVFRYPTLVELANALRVVHHMDTTEVLVPMQTAGSHLPFFCVHPLGGSIARYYLLSNVLGADYPFYGLQVPDLGEWSEMNQSIEAMAACYIDAMRTIQPQGPYLLGGWSMGGVVAFEMAQQLHVQGEVVRLVALLDSNSDNFPDLPLAPQVALDTSNAALIRKIIEHANIVVPDEILEQRDPDDQLAYLLGSNQLQAILPAALTIEQAYSVLRIYITHIHALRSYIPRIAQCHLTLLRAIDNVREVAPEQEDEIPRAHILSRGWERLTDGGLDIYPVPGGHSTMLAEPHIHILAEYLKRSIDAASLL